MFSPDYANKVERIATQARDELRPKDRVWLARFLLDTVDNEDFTYAEFESAQAVERYVKQARRALSGLPLA